MTQPRVGVVGLGLMGSGMAANLVGKGFPTMVWNRTPARTEPLVALGARRAATPAALAAECDFAVTCVADPEALEDVATGRDGLLAGARRGLRWIDCSTVGRAAMLALGARAVERGVELLEAPVTGSKVGAQKGTLVAMTGGDPATHEAGVPVLSAFCARVIHCGPLGAASVVKLVGNTLISFMLEGLAEGLTAAARAGVSPDKVLEVVQASGFASGYWPFKGGAMIRRDFETHFSLDLMAKDQRLMLDEAAARGVAMPGLATIHQMTLAACALGAGGEDIAAQVKAVEALSQRK